MTVPLTHETYVELLAGGGLTLPEPGAEPTPSPLPKYNGSRDPAGVERLGTELARSVSAAVATTPDLVVVWQDPEDLVLAHVVARELGTTVLRLMDLDGLVGHEGPVPRHASAVIVSDAVRDGSVVRAMVALIERANSTVVAVATLAVPEFDTVSDIGAVPAVTSPAARADSSAVTA